MRKKVEKKIRQAVSALERSERYRIDRVREKAGVIRKVFDKTILDMARVGTIELSGGDTSAMSPSEKGNLIQEGDRLHVYFKFLDAKANPENPPYMQTNTPASPPEMPLTASEESERIDIVLLEIESDSWLRFQTLCNGKEGKRPEEKILEMIRDYNRKGEN